MCTKSKHKCLREIFVCEILMNMLRSKESNIRSFVKFINLTERHVDVFWMNFHGKKISFSTLTPGSHCSVSKMSRLRDFVQVFRHFKFFNPQINTYVTHPWIFNCAETGESLKVNQNFVFYPEPWFRFITNSENGVVSVGRQEIEIHYPLKSLKNICMWKILFLVKTTNDINNLDIPNSLQNELTQLINESNRKLPENNVDDND